MDNFKETLIICFKQDIKEINMITNNMKNHVKNFDLNSWIFPLKNSFDVCEIEEESYVKYLELLLDRLYLYVNLVVKFLEELLTGGKNSTPKNVVLPKNITFGRITKILSEHLFHLRALLKKNHKATNLEEGTKENEAQTETDVLRNCDSCFLSINCIKKILQKLNIKNIDRNVYEVTQFGFMLEATNIIAEHVDNFLLKINKFGGIQKQLKNEIKECRELMTNKTKIIIMQEEKIKVLDKLLDKEKTKLEDAIKLNNELNKERVKINENVELLEKNITELNSTITGYEKTIDEKSQKNSLLEECIEHISFHLDALLSHNFSLRDYLYKITKVKAKIENEIATLQCNFLSLTETMSDIKNSFEGLNERTIKLLEKYDENDLLQKDLQTKIQTLINYTNRPTMNKIVSTHDLNLATDEFQVEGEPLNDMKKQIDVNIEKITHLQDQNVRLLETIRKLRKVTGKTYNKEDTKNTIK